MTIGPRVSHMTRSLLIVLLAVPLAAFGACSVRPASEGGDPSTKVVKAEVDAAAQKILPALATSVGGRLVGMQATFHERSGFGIWDYGADGSLLKPPGSMATVLDVVASTLGDNEFTVTRDAEEKRVTGERGNVSVILQAGLLSDDAKVSSLQVSLGSIRPTSEGDDFAESAPAEDYLAYLE